jgi:hypothetical protein
LTVYELIDYLLDEKSDELNPKSKEEHYTWLKMRKIKAFYTEVNAKTLRQGASALMQVISTSTPIRFYFNKRIFKPCDSALVLESSNLTF